MADERKSWDMAEKMHELTDKVRSLEVDKLTLSQQLQRVESGDVGGGKAYAVTTMMRERDEAAHKLHLEETRRKSAEQRVTVLEDEVRQLHSLLEETRRRSAELEADGAEQEYKARRIREEGEGMQRLLEATRAQVHDTQSALHQAQVELERSRSDFGACRQRKDQVEAELQNAHEALGAARRQTGLKEEEGSEARARVQALETELRNLQLRGQRELQERDEDAQRLRQRLAQLEVQLPAVSQERDMVSEEAKHLRRQLDAETEARLRSETLRVEEQTDIRRALDEKSRELTHLRDANGKMSAQHELDETRAAELTACVGPLQSQLVEAQTVCSEASRQARETVGEMEQRCRILADKLAAEKRRSSDLSRELGAAYEAARILQVRNGQIPKGSRDVADLVEWKEQALRTLHSQRAALSALSQAAQRKAAAESSPDRRVPSENARDYAPHYGASPSPPQEPSQPQVRTPAYGSSHFETVYDDAAAQQSPFAPPPRMGPEQTPAKSPAAVGVSIPAWLVRATSDPEPVGDLETPEVRRIRARRVDTCSEVSDMGSDRGAYRRGEVSNLWWMSPESAVKTKKKAPRKLKRAASSESMLKPALGRTASRNLLR